MWGEFTYPFPNFNGCTVEVWEWISNFIPHYIMDVITKPRWHSTTVCIFHGIYCIEFVLWSQSIPFRPQMHELWIIPHYETGAKHRYYFFIIQQCRTSCVYCCLWYEQFGYDIPSVCVVMILSIIFSYSVKQLILHDQNLLHAGGRLNKKDGLTRYGDSHVKDKTS